ALISLPAVTNRRTAPGSPGGVAPDRRAGDSPTGCTRPPARVGIASKWEGSADGLTWTFTIRNGVKFHDGTEVTAEDVLWTLRHVIGPQAKDYTTTSDTLVSSGNMERIEQTGPNEVTLVTKTPVSTSEAVNPGETSRRDDYCAGVTSCGL